MAQKSIGGVAGVLGGLISNAIPASPEPPAARTKAAAELAPQEAAQCRAKSRTHARLGRPPGRQPGRSGKKEKLTVRIDAELAETYRDWSWTKRCQLGELIEQALRAYRNRKGE